MEIDDNILKQQQMDEMNFSREKMNMDRLNQSMNIEEQNKSTVKEQLDLTDEIAIIQNLLRGRCQVVENGDLTWKDPATNEDVLLTEAGINLVLNAVQWYMNKNTLLSNYDEETIALKMEDFSIALSDALFMNYEKYFLYPTAEECQLKLIERLKKKQQDIIYTKRMQGKEDIDEKAIWQGLVVEIDPSVERNKIREQLIKNKLKGFELLMREIQDIVHSTYLRALGGAERRTLRQHITVSENRNPDFRPTPGRKGLLGFGGR